MLDRVGVQLSEEAMSQVKSSDANPRLITSNVGSIDRRIGMFVPERKVSSVYAKAEEELVGNE